MLGLRALLKTARRAIRRSAAQRRRNGAGRNASCVHSNGEKGAHLRSSVGYDKYRDRRLVFAIVTGPEVTEEMLRESRFRADSDQMSGKHAEYCDMRRGLGRERCPAVSWHRRQRSSRCGPPRSSRSTPSPACRRSRCAPREGLACEQSRVGGGGPASSQGGVRCSGCGHKGRMKMFLVWLPLPCARRWTGPCR